MKIKFSKNIFQVWFQDIKNLKNKLFLENINNWKTLNPDWNYKCVNDKDLQNACKLYSNKCYNAYNSAKTMHTKIDLGKIVLIYLYGGIMIDMDMYVLRSLSSSDYINNFIQQYEHNGKDILGISKFNSNCIESLISCGYFQFYNNAMLISNPKNNLLKIYIDIIINNIYKYSNLHFSDYIYVQKTSGPIVFNSFIQTYGNAGPDGNLIIFDYTIFEPCNANNNCVINNNTIAIHNYEMSWMPSIIKQLLLFYYSYFNYILILLAIIFYYLFKKN